MEEDKSIRSTRGKKSRTSGRTFELKVRVDLEKNGWVVSKWANNFDLNLKKVIKTSIKFNPFKKFFVAGTGFPDFVAFKIKDNLYEVIGVEVKANGWLDKEEKEKCKGLLENKIFSKILVASRGKKRGTILYKEFENA